MEIRPVDAGDREETNLGPVGRRNFPPRFLVANQDRPGPGGATPPAPDQAPAELLGEDPVALPRPGFPAVFRLEALGVALPSADRTPDEGNVEAGSDVIRHPIIGERRVLGQVESDRPPELPDFGPGQPLPEIIIKMQGEGFMPERLPPELVIEIAEADPGRLAAHLGPLDPRPVPGLRQDPGVVEPGDLVDDVPAEDGFTGGEELLLLGRARFQGRVAGEGGDQNIQAFHGHPYFIRENRRDARPALKREMNEAARGALRTVQSFSVRPNGSRRPRMSPVEAPGRADTR